MDDSEQAGDSAAHDPHTSRDRYEAGGGQLFEDDWLSGRCVLVDTYRRLRSEGASSPLDAFLRGLAAMDDEDCRDRARLALGHWLRRDTSCNLGSGEAWKPSPDEVADLGQILRGAATAVLAADAQRRWERSAGRDERDGALREFAEHAATAITCFSEATPLTDRRPWIDVRGGGELPRSQAALIAAVREKLLDVSRLRSCGWLSLEWLLGECLDCAPAVECEQPIHLLLFGGMGQPTGLAELLEVALVPASQPGLFLDRSVAGGLLILDTMRDSLRQAHDWARRHAERRGTSRNQDYQPLAVRIRPRFSLPVVRFSGGSAGVLLACAMRGVLERQPLNRHATATACLVAESSRGHVAADAVADESVLAKLEATGLPRPRLTHVVMQKQQADMFRRHEDVTPLRLTIHGVESVQAAYAYLTREAELDDLLRDHGRRVAAGWGQLQRQGEAESQDDFHRLDRYVWPRYGVLPAGQIPVADSSRDDRAFESFKQDEEKDGGTLAAGYQPVAGEGDERLVELLATHRWLCVTEDAGAGKTVLSLKAHSLAVSPVCAPRLFDGPPLVVRLESRWPVDPQDRPLPLEQMLTLHLRKSLQPQPPEDTLLVDAVQHALQHRRVLLILDAWDQFSRQQRTFIGTEVLAPAGAAAGCRVLVTSREFAVHRDKETVFLPSRWRFAKIAGFNRREQAEYLSDLDGDWQRMVPHPDQVQDLLRIPDVLRMIRQIIEQTPDRGKLPQFTSRGQLYLEASQRMLQRALQKQQEELRRFPDLQNYSPQEQFALLRHVIGVLAFQMCLEGRYDYSVPGPTDDSNALESFLDAAWLRFSRSAPASRSESETRQRWKLAVDVLKTIELSHRSVVEAWTREVLSFRSRKMMEWYAGYHLANHATDVDLEGERLPGSGRATSPPRALRTRSRSRFMQWVQRLLGLAEPRSLAASDTNAVAREADTPPANRDAAVHFTNDSEWYWVWRFAVEMPQSSFDGHASRDRARFCRSLSMLFRQPHSGSPPVELMYRAWHLFERESERKIRDKFPYETDARGQARLLPGAEQVIQAWRWSFWERFADSDWATQEEALWLIPEDILWSVIRLARGRATAEETRLAERSLGLDVPRLRQLGRWLGPHRREILRRWRTVRQRSWPEDPWPGERYYPDRAYQNCPPIADDAGRFPVCPDAAARSREVAFLQGVAEREQAAWDHERPRHAVRLAPFQLQTFSVTEGQFALFDPARSIGQPEAPVVDVNWYASWALSRQLGPVFRLPTESEYEFAARGQTDTPYWWQSDVLDRRRCNMMDSQIGRSLDRSETRRHQDRYVNRFGLWHMSGNVWQWVWDGYRSDWYGRSRDSEDDDGGPVGAGGRVRRSSSYRYVNAGFCRSSFRVESPAGHSSNDIGFRLCRVVDLPDGTWADA